MSPGKSSKAESPMIEEDPRQFEFRYDRRAPRSADKTSSSSMMQKRKRGLF